MMCKFKIHGVLLVFILLSSLGSEATGQYSTTAYHMYGIPQANQLNPAFQPSCSWYLGMPGLSPFRLKVESTSIGYNDIFTYDDNLNAFISFMHPNSDKGIFMDALKTHNNIRMDASFDILSFGFKKEQMFFSLDITERIENTIILPEDFFEFAVYLSKHQDRFSFADMGGYSRYWREIAIGMSYNVDDEFQVGGRAKILLGVANVRARVTDMNIITSTDVWDISSRIDVDISAPGVVTYAQADGLMDSIDFDSDILESEIISTALGFGNPGFGIDFGFQYRPLDYLTVSGSINDLGFIKWKNNVTNLANDGAFTFDGLAIDILGDGGDDEQTAVDQMIDSLSSQLDFYVSNDPYTTMLSGGFHLGAAYELNEKVRFGVVDRIRIYKAKFYNQFTLSANVQPIRAFSASFSYSVIGNNFTNIGLGLSMYAGPLNLYFITDQLLSAALIPSSLQSLNFRLGMNLVFGCSKKKKEMGDRPLID